MAIGAKNYHVNVQFHMCRTNPFIFLRRLKINHTSLLGYKHLFVRMVLSWTVSPICPDLLIWYSSIFSKSIVKLFVTTLRFHLFHLVYFKPAEKETVFNDVDTYLHWYKKKSRLSFKPLRHDNLLEPWILQAWTRIEVFPGQCLCLTAVSTLLFQVYVVWRLSTESPWRHGLAPCPTSS